jgi:nucleotidyltransferase/DNA polymerase involved in DNA repair
MDFNVSKQLFAHIDCDCFYASCEVMRDPKLRDKCVCVGWDIIITSNYKARKYGVKVGTPIWEAERLIPKKDFVLLPPDMSFYGQTSDRMHHYLSHWSNGVERFSIDESWADITGVPLYKGMDNKQFALFLQSELLKKVGIPVSIGISNTRLRAKILSEIHKPMGVCIWVDSFSFLDKAGWLEFWDIPFIGPASQEKLKHTVRDWNIAGFLEVGFWKLKEVLGKNGTDVWLEMKGVNAFHPKRQETDKSISATRIFNYHKTSEKAYVWDHLMMNFERAYERLIDKNLETNHIIISFRDKERRVFGLNKRLGRHTQRKNEIIEIISALFEKVYSPDVIYRTTGVIFTDLEKNTPKQYSFEEQAYIAELVKDQKLEQIINGINKKFGRRTLTRGGSGSIDPRYMSEHLEENNNDECQRIKGFVEMILV